MLHSIEIKHDIPDFFKQKKVEISKPTNPTEIVQWGDDLVVLDTVFEKFVFSWDVFQQLDRLHISAQILILNIVF